MPFEVGGVGRGGVGWQCIALSMHQQKHLPGKTANHRFPTLTDDQVWEVASLKHVVKRKPDDAPLVVRLVDPSDVSRVLSVRDRTNIRDVPITVRRQTKRLLVDGWWPTCRDQPRGRFADARNPDVFHFVNGGAITASMIKGIRQCPTNPHMLKLIRGGLHGVEELHRETPDDICKFRKQWSNRFHGGNDDTTVEVLQEVKDAKSNWGVHAHDKRIENGNCPSSGKLSLKAMQENYIMRNHGKCIEGFDVFLNVCQLLQIFDDLHMWDKYRQMYEERCDVEAASAKQHAIIIDNTLAFVKKATFYQDAHSLYVLRMAILEGCGVFFPFDEECAYGPPCNVEDFLFNKIRTNLINLMDEPMQGTIMFKKATVRASRGCSKDSKDSSKDCEKQMGKGRLSGSGLQPPVRRNSLTCFRRQQVSRRKSSDPMANGLPHYLITSSRPSSLRWTVST